MFGVGGFELFLILVFAFLIFGPDKLPELANILGKGLAKFREAKEEMSDILNPKDFISDDPDQPINNPIEVFENAAAKIDSKRNAAKKDQQESAADKNTNKKEDR